MSRPKPFALRSIVAHATTSRGRLGRGGAGLRRDPRRAAIPRATGHSEHAVRMCRSGWVTRGRTARRIPGLRSRRGHRFGMATRGGRRACALRRMRIALSIHQTVRSVERSCAQLGEFRLLCALAALGAIGCSTSQGYPTCPDGGICTLLDSALPWTSGGYTCTPPLTVRLQLRLQRPSTVPAVLSRCGHREHLPSGPGLRAGSVSSALRGLL